MVLRHWLWGKYLNLRRRMWGEKTENCVMRSLMIWTSCRTITEQVHAHDMPVQVQGDPKVWIQFIRSVAVILGWVLSTTPRTLYPGKHSLPTVQEAGWESGPVRTDTKFSAAPVFKPRTIQLIASRHTDWVIAAAYRKRTRWLNLREWEAWVLWFWWENHEENRTLERPKRRWKNNNKIELM